MSMQFKGEVSRGAKIDMINKYLMLHELSLKRNECSFPIDLITVDGYAFALTDEGLVEFAMRSQPPATPESVGAILLMDEEIDAFYEQVLREWTGKEQEQRG